MGEEAPVSVYPAQYESDVVVRDGSTLRLRPVRVDDAGPLRELYERLPEASRQVIGLQPLPDASSLAAVDYDNEFVLVAEAGGRLSGVARYLRESQARDRADV